MIPWAVDKDVLTFAFLSVHGISKYFVANQRFMFQKIFANVEMCSAVVQNKSGYEIMTSFSLPSTKQQ